MNAGTANPFSSATFKSSHGNYPEGYVPEFDFERLKEIKEKTKMPLVLHGGSGSGDENIKRCVEFKATSTLALCASFLTIGAIKLLSQ